MSAIRCYLRNVMAVTFPRLWYNILKYKTYKTNKVVNDLRIHPQLSLSYQTDGTYVTMFKAPPRHYNKINRDRTYDEMGIPLYEEKYYNLVSICQYGLTEYGYYKNTGNNMHYDHVKAVCKWLVDNQEANTGYWRYKFDFYHRATGYTLKNWPSALGQGQAASLLVRMFLLTNEFSYLDTALNAFNMFDVPINDGGLLADFNGYPVYEEYPTIPSSFTLNGMIFSLFGLYDYLQVKDDDRIRKLWLDGVNAVEYMLPLYDDDISSNYDISHMTARIAPKVKADKYHLIHIALLQNLESISPRPTFEYYIRKWAKMSGFSIK